MIAPTAAMSSYPYAPKESLKMMKYLYKNHGKELWGEFGFYDSFNLQKYYIAHSFLGIDVGPIAPMIENSRSSFCCDTFMKAPEIQNILKLTEK